MRYIPLRKVTTRKDRELDYRQQLELVVGELMELGNGQRQGFDRDSNRRALRVLDALEDQKDSSTLALEDADHQWLAQRIDLFIWPWADHAFETFCEDVVNANGKPEVKKAKAD